MALSASGIDRPGAGGAAESALTAIKRPTLDLARSAARRVRCPLRLENVSRTRLVPALFTTFPVGSLKGATPYEVVGVMVREERLLRGAARLRQRQSRDGRESGSPASCAISFRAWRADDRFSFAE
jgi:hypothetical protein